LSLTDVLFLTLASATLCVALPKLLSILIVKSDEQTQPASQETLSQATAKGVSTFPTEA
jgi:hypothetical protein